jgi:hypothetical protein
MPATPAGTERRLRTNCGLATRCETWEMAHRAFRRTPHGRTVRLKTDMAIGELVHGF